MIQSVLKPEPSRAIKIEIKEQTSEVRIAAGESITVERASVQIGTNHVLKIVCVDGKWLHYDIESSGHARPKHIERFFLDQAFQRHKK